MKTTRYAVDVITFYDPRFWGLSNGEELLALSERSPELIWGGIFETLEASGISGLELTFAPADYRAALRAFGSAAAFRRDLDARGLEIVSGFWTAGEWNHNADPDTVAAAAGDYIAFLSEAGAGVLVSGLPMRATFGERPARFIDGRYLQHMADVAHAVGAAAADAGLRLALHTESNSALWYSRDVDAIMALTDPEYVGLCPDAAHLTLGGSDAVRVVERHWERIVLAHWKDAAGPLPIRPVIDETVFEAHRPYMTTLGEGVVDWPGWAKLMAGTPGAGIVLIELDSAADPIGAMTSSRAFVESLLAQMD